jgi:hypothetical protein
VAAIVVGLVVHRLGCKRRFECLVGLA